MHIANLGWMGELRDIEQWFSQWAIERGVGGVSDREHMDDISEWILGSAADDEEWDTGSNGIDVDRSGKMGWILRGRYWFIIGL